MDTGVKGDKGCLNFGHVVRSGGMEDDVMLGRMNGARKRGRPRHKTTIAGHTQGVFEPPSTT